MNLLLLRWISNYFEPTSKSSEGWDRQGCMIATSEFLFHCHEYHNTAKPFDPEQAWADHLNRLADIDKLYPSKSPLLARHISPPLSTKRLFDIHGEYHSRCFNFLSDVWFDIKVFIINIGSSHNLLKISVK